jgi:tetratricopeptide (TPR) repeat protein
MIALANQGQILLERGLYQESIENFENALKRIPNKEKFSLRGLKLMKLISVPEEVAKMWIGKGKAHKNLQQYSEALESFNKALEFNPDSEEAKKNKDEVLGILNS